MSRFIIISFALFVTLIGCSQKTEKPENIESEISKSWNQFKTAWIAGDAHLATTAFYTEDAINIELDLPEQVGRNTIETIFAGFLSTSKIVTFDQSTQEVEVSYNLAYERGNLTQTIQSHVGAIRIETGRYLAIWKRQTDGSWKCSRFFFNNAPKSS